MNHGDTAHRHMIVTAFVSNPPLTAQSGEVWLRKLVDIVDMQILFDAKAIFCEDLGNEGVTGVVGLTTSHASFHSWHLAEEPFVQMDLYSCRDFSMTDVLNHFSEWGMTRCNYVVLNRDPELEMLRVIHQGVYRA